MPPLFIHIWPGKWNLSSIDVACLSVVLYLQLALPGRFRIVEETSPELSPSGQLPFISHLGQSVSPLPSLYAYLASLDLSTLDSEEDEETLPPPRTSLDNHLSSAEKAQSLAWRVYIESRMGDLVAHSMYSSHSNYYSVTRPALVSMLPLPQRFYVPGRIRALQRERLRGAFMWEEGEETEETSKSQFFSVEKTSGSLMQRAFNRERLVEKARDIFETLSGLVPGNDSFVYGDNPSLVDAVLAAHILFILHIPFPDPVLKTILLESFPLLVSHALLVHSRAFQSSSTKPYVERDLAGTSGFHILVRSTNLWIGGVRSVLCRLCQGTLWKESFASRNTGDELDQKLRSGRRVWFILAGLGAASYAYTVGLVKVIPTVEAAERTDIEVEIDSEDVA
ncbi:uncharacterized protein EI90DRAFT_3284450 [Cantharellus anzutake]|uniref:uncharacterized protein n=1 Tax=Cantharellus anzutake TaxID=1750568 RepID=UPI001908659C|nr:uncharacterized protein EI90DRAFT_3284450 [Cantharellus anzutake]KAF8343898.1 hypothetical protein EI90DRAFT_3284450 [Cantharellus anzutake]